jgi:hypothetical protein
MLRVTRNVVSDGCSIADSFEKGWVAQDLLNQVAGWPEPGSRVGMWPPASEPRRYTGLSDW